MVLLIIRHGESEADLLDVHEGRADFELTAAGHRQAEKMSRWVKERYSVDKIYCSPLKRARQTAAYLAEQFELPLQIDDKLMEFNNGLIAGLSRQAAQEAYPYVENLPVHKAVYEQESKLEFRFRADYMLSKLLFENDPEETVAVISHGGMINQLYQSFIHAPLGCNVFCATGDTGIHAWRIDGDKRIILFSNSCQHTHERVSPDKPPNP